MIMLRTKIGGNKCNRLVVRFKRKGCIRYPLYDIVVMKAQTRRDGEIIERLGFFNPNSKFKVLVIDSSRLAFWVSRGGIVQSAVKERIAKFVV
jgi:small subunit ribosomal protein S16